LTLFGLKEATIEIVIEAAAVIHVRVPGRIEIEIETGMIRVIEEDEETTSSRESNGTRIEKDVGPII